MLMRYGGVRISDAVIYQPAKLNDGKLFLYQSKTGEPVWVPLPQVAINAILWPTHFWGGAMEDLTTKPAVPTCPLSVDDLFNNSPEFESQTHFVLEFNFG